jgi:hypothetical protein
LLLLAKIRENTHALQGHVFTNADCQQWAGIKSTEAANRIKILMEAGYIDRAESRGHAHQYRLTGIQRVEAPALHVLVRPEELLRPCRLKPRQPGPPIPDIDDTDDIDFIEV